VLQMIQWMAEKVWRKQKPNALFLPHIMMWSEMLWQFCLQEIRSNTTSSTNQNKPFEYKHYIGPQKFSYAPCTAKQMEQDRQCTSKRDTVVHSRNQCCLGKTMNITHSVCVCVSVAWACQANASITSSPVTVWLYNIFPHYVINGPIFGKRLLNIKCVLWLSLQLLSEEFLILKWIQWYNIISIIYIYIYTQINSNLIKIWQEWQALHVNTDIYIYIYI
jgi:hypothetical protein